MKNTMGGDETAQEQERERDDRLPPAWVAGGAGDAVADITATERIEVAGDGTDRIPAVVRDGRRATIGDYLQVPLPDLPASVAVDDEEDCRAALLCRVTAVANPADDATDLRQAQLPHMFPDGDAPAGHRRQVLQLVPEREVVLDEGDSDE